MKPRLLVVAGAGLVSIIGVGTGAADPPVTDPGALRGPSVVTPGGGPNTIVERDFQGRLKRLEDHPALVALARVELTAQEKATVDRALGDRAAALDTIIRDNLKLVIEYAGAEQAKDHPAVARLRAELFQKAEPFLKRGPIMGEIKGSLPAARFAELKRMVDEYNRIGTDERMTDPMQGGGGGKPGEKPDRFGATLAQGFEGFGQEVKASFQRVVDAGGKEFDNLLNALDLTSEQEGRIRQKATDLYLKTYGKPTKGQQFRLFLDIYGELDPQQRRKLALYIGEENRAKRGLKPRSEMQDDKGTP